MPLEPLILRLADEFLELIKRETGFDTIVCDETGTIVRATVQSRIGTPHPGSQRIMRREADEVAITAEDAKRNPLVKECLNCPIVIEGRRVGTFGIAGPLEITRPLVRIASFALSGLTGYVSVNRDVTARKRAEAQLLFTERLAAIGTLAAGVAHEINTPLAFIVANLTFAREELRKPDLDRKEVLDALGEVSEGAARVREIVQSLRSFSHQEEPIDRPVDVTKVLQSSLTLAQNEIRRRARLVTELTAVPPVRASECRLGQVFLNLLINAAQSITEGNADQNQIRLVTRLEGTGGTEQVVVEVHDTGCGIAPDILDRIFDPFFTTKPLGMGSGLGLSICHGIVTSLGGEIEVESQLGSGSVFRVMLPLASEEAVAPL